MSCVTSVTIVVPALNEEAYIRRAIESLVPQDERLDYEMLVLDGGSTDRTRQIVAELASANARIRLVPNEAKLQSAAVNKAARMAKASSEVIVRADCHSIYPPGFVSRAIVELRKRQAASLVVPLHTAGRSPFQRAVAAAQNSRLGNGGSPHRSKVESRYVDHGHHAMFDRAVFLSMGGYDETFSHNEDAELDVRLIRSGAKIWLCSELAVTYFPRSSLGALASQYFKYGSGRARTMFKHRCPPKLRQALPLAVLGTNVASAILGVGAGWIFLSPLLAYATLCLAWSVMLAGSRRDAACLASGLAAAVMHHGWATGFVYRSAQLLAAPRSSLRAPRPA
ncbi:MAG TPA: glycosyltransferase family 2 protein [Xanthobacteraceae bacterium]|nr:glycosyltransferase family 2 protein [Xanthobacteraceae bacterium]